MTQSPLIALLNRRRPVLLDGAVGTELGRRGVDTTLPFWSGHALTEPRGLEILRAIHEAYARAGADMLVTNTFRTTLRSLESVGLGDDWRALNQRAVEAARAGAAAGAKTACLVAGGIAPLEDCYSPDLVPEEAACLTEHRRQAELLAELGVDLILIETMNRRREARAALSAACETGLEVVISLCPQPPNNLLSGEPLEEVIPDLLRLGGSALRGILLNCATPDELERVYPRFTALVPDTPHGLYAHLGEPDETIGWTMPERHEPERYADWIVAHCRQGTRFVGGCCGTTPDHISAIATRLSTF